MAQEECEIIIYLLRIFEDILGGTLVMWNIKPIGFELKDYTKPFCLRPYPVLRVHEDMVRKEVKGLVSLGVLEHVNDLEWGYLYRVHA